MYYHFGRDDPGTYQLSARGDRESTDVLLRTVRNYCAVQGTFSSVGIYIATTDGMSNQTVQGAILCVR